MPLNPSHISTAVERVPSCAWTSSSLALTILKIFSCWLGLGKKFPNQLRNAIVLPYFFFSLLEVIR